MKTQTEKNVDAGALASFEDGLLPCVPDEMNLKCPHPYQTGMRATGFEKDSLPEQHKEFINPYTAPKISNIGSMGNTPPVKEPGLIGKAANWIKDNPGTAILGALLIGGGTYLLINYLKDTKSKNADETSPAKRRRIRQHKPENKLQEETGSASSITPKEIAIGVAAAAGGALAGTVMGDYAVAASVPAGVIGIASNNIPLIAAAIGLVFSVALKKVFQSFFGNEAEKESEMNKKGYLKTMLGYIKPGETRLSPS